MGHESITQGHGNAAALQGWSGTLLRQTGVGISNKKVEMTVPDTAAASELPGHHQLLTGVCATCTMLFLSPESVPEQERGILTPTSSPQLGTAASALINTPP